MSGPEQCDEWRREGRRIIPLLPRSLPITGFSQIAKAAKDDISSLNHELPSPWETSTLRAPSPLKREVKTPEPEFVKPEPVEQQQNGVTPDKIKIEVKEEVEEDETGLVFLPSGMAVRLREEKPQPGKKGGKRKRSMSKSIEVFPKGVPISSPNGRRDSVGSPPRKVSSPQSPVHQAGHGYARPPPPAPPLLPPTLAMSPSKMNEPQLYTPLKRGPGRPPGPSSPSIGRGQGPVRPRAPRASRARGPRGSRGRGGASRGSAPPNSLPPGITQSPLVQGPGLPPAGMFSPLHPGARTFNTSTPKVGGFGSKDLYAQLNSLPASSSGGMAGLTQNYPQDLSSSGEGKQSLHSLTQAIGYLQAQAQASGNQLNSQMSQGPPLPTQDSSSIPAATHQLLNPQFSSAGLAQGVSHISSQSLSRFPTQTITRLNQGITQLSTQKTGLARDHLTSVLNSQTASNLQMTNSGVAGQNLQFAGQPLSQFNPQGLKVISHNAKIVPKSGSTVYVMPGSGGQRMLTPGPRIVTVSMAGGGSGNPRLTTPGVSSVIRTIRTSAFAGGTNKSVIVVQKSGPASIRASRPNSVALYRPATMAPRGMTPLVRGAGPGVMRIPSLQRPTLMRQQSGNGNLYLVELGQDQQQPAASPNISSAAMLSNNINPNYKTSIAVSNSTTAFLPKNATTLLSNNSTTLLPNSPNLVSVLPNKPTTTLFPGQATNHLQNKTATLLPNSAPATHYPNSVSILPNNTPTTYTTMLPNNTPTSYTSLLPNNTPTTYATLLPNNTPTSFTTLLPNNTPTTYTTLLPNSTPTTYTTLLPNSTPTTYTTLLPHSTTSIHPSSTTTMLANPLALQRMVATKPVLNSSKSVPIVISSSSQTLSKKLIVQAGEPTKNTDLWIQVKEGVEVKDPGTNKTGPDPVRLPVKTAAALPLQEGDEPSYSDIFSQALEQANIPADTPLVHPDLASDLSATLSATTGRFVTLPPRANAAPNKMQEQLMAEPSPMAAEVQTSSAAAEVKISSAAAVVPTQAEPVMQNVGEGSHVNEIKSQTSL